MSEITKIDVKSGPGVYRHYENLNLSSWYLIAEYVDNAIGSYQRNRRELEKLNPRYKLQVRIIRDADKKTITIQDNAAGISDKDLNRAFVIGERPEDTSGANEYGVGMKLASFHFTHRWHARTKALGETVEKTVILDVDDIERRNDTEVDVIRVPKSSEDHGTEIYLEKFYDSNWPQYKSVNKIKTFLASIFRKYIENGDLDLRFEDGGLEEIIVPHFPDILDMPFVNDPDYPDSKSIVWKQEVNFVQNTFSREITGWVGILDHGQTKKKFAGIELVRRNRVVEGGEHAWFPEEIYGRGHAEPGTRLFGELVFKGFSTNNNKSKIDWGTEDQETKEQFIEYLHDLIIKDKDTGQRRDFWEQLYNFIAKVAKEKKEKDYSLKKQISESNEDSESRLKSDFSGYSAMTEEDFESTADETEFLPENALPEKMEFKFPHAEGEDWLVIFSPNEGDGQGVWFKATSIETSEWPKQITIEWDINHPYSQLAFRPGDDIGAYSIIGPELFRLIAIIVISQEQLRESGRDNIGVDYFVSKLNSMLGKF